MNAPRSKVHFVVAGSNVIIDNFVHLPHYFYSSRGIKKLYRHCWRNTRRSLEEHMVEE